MLSQGESPSRSHAHDNAAAAIMVAAICNSPTARCERPSNLVGPLGSGGVDRFDYVRRRRIMQHVSSRLNDLLRHGLALEGAAAGSVLSGGLGRTCRTADRDVADLAGTTRPQSGPPYALGGDTLEALSARPASTVTTSCCSSQPAGLHKPPPATCTLVRSYKIKRRAAAPSPRIWLRPPGDQPQRRGAWSHSGGHRRW
jgi:hypothetical protein